MKEEETQFISTQTSTSTSTSSPQPQPQVSNPLLHILSVITWSVRSKKEVIVVGIDDNKESIYCLEWTLDHLFKKLGSLGRDSPAKLFLVHAKIPPASAVKMSGPGVGDVLAVVERNIKRKSQAVVEKAREICLQRSIINFEVEVCEGDARNVLCETAKKHNADMLIVGSHGYGALKRVLLGSVSDYCARHAHCSVLIVKMPKDREKKSSNNGALT